MSENIKPVQKQVKAPKEADLKKFEFDTQEKFKTEYNRRYVAVIVTFDYPIL